MLGLGRTVTCFRQLDSAVPRFSLVRLTACFSSSSDTEKTQLFFSDGVQNILKKLTRPNMEKIFRKRREGKELKDVTYKFMTTAQLDEVVKEAEERASKLLQMPPIMSEREEIDEVLEKDDRLIGLMKSKFIFTDISLGKTDRSRTIVARDEDGTLRLASWEERARMNQTYFPQPARELWVPIMFRDENFKTLLDKKEYEFVLDRACLQFEPDDPEYIRVTNETYEHVNSSKEFEVLRSTRHFGPLVFHLALTNNLDNLIIENLETDRLEDAIWSLQLYNTLHPESKIDHKYERGSELEFVKAFIEQRANEKAKLELAFKNCKDLLSNPRSAAIG